MSDLIVLVDDEAENLIYLQKVLRHHKTEAYTNPLDALEFIRNNDSISMLITDQKMPGLSGLELVRIVNSEKNGILSIIISAYTDPDDLVDAVNSRLIHKYVVKPFNPQKMREFVDETLSLLPLTRTMNYLASGKTTEQSPLDSFLTATPAGMDVKTRAQFFSQSDLPLFIHGETGTGKEVLARAVHELSPRNKGPFIAVNCAALTKDLFLSEMYGHAKGAFSGAVADTQGFVCRAEGGTLFLDEVSEISMEHQASLLRFIENYTYYPVGSSREKKSDIRVISASHKRLSTLKNEKLFREDLFYRLSPLELKIPALRKRKDDIALLFMHYFEDFRKEGVMLTPSAWKELLNYQWNGNVRELIHTAEKISLNLKMFGLKSVSRKTIREVLDTDSEDLNMDLSVSNEPLIPGKINLAEHLTRIEREIISNYLKSMDFNISRTAEALGLSRQGLKNKMKRYDVAAQEE